MNVLVTGNRGFIASGLSPKFDGLDIKNDPAENICGYQAKKTYDVIIHTAALTSVTESFKDPQLYACTNVLGTANLLNQHPEAHFIYLSTASIYGEGLDHTINSPVDPKSVYASTKLAGEYLVRNLAKSWCILRLTNVTGKGVRGEPNVYQVFEKEPILPIFGDGLQTRDFVDVDFVRDIILKSFYKEGIFNVGRGQSKTILDVAREFDKPVRFFPKREGEIEQFGIGNAVGNFTQL